MSLKKESEYTKNHINLLKWLRKNGINLANTNLQIYDNDYRGLHATRDIPYNEIVLKITENCLIQEKQIIANNWVRILREKFEIGSENYKDFIEIAVFNLYEMKNPNSRYVEYYNTLPKNVEHSFTVFYDKTKLCKLLQGSNILCILYICEEL